jgi:hypothetical protein
MALITMGKKDSRNTSMIFGEKPKPNHTMNRGATAILGMIWKRTSRGYSVACTVGENAMSSASGIDTRTPRR